MKIMLSEVVLKTKKSQFPQYDMAGFNSVRKCLD